MRIQKASHALQKFCLWAPLALSMACQGAINNNDRRPSDDDDSGGDDPEGGAPPDMMAPRGMAEFTCAKQDLPTPPPRRLRRLTPSQYANTTTVFLDGSPAADGSKPKPVEGVTIPLEPAGGDHRFKTYSADHSLTNFEFARLLPASSQIATRLVTSLGTNSCWSSAMSGGAADACLETLIKQRGAILFRRPLKSEEVALYTGLAKSNAGMFGRDEALGIAFESMLMAPQFLFIAELGEPMQGSQGVAQLTPFETAAALAYTLTEAPADESLWAAAEAGKLATADEIKAQVLRILATPAASAGREFISEYFRLGRVLQVNKSLEEKCEYGKARIMQDALMVVDDVYATHGRKDFLKTLLTTSVGFAGCDSYKIYGLSAEPQEDTRLTLPAQQRSGLLTHPAFLAGTSTFEQTLPVKRGRFINESILCQEIPEVPLDVVAKLDKPELTMREQLEVHVGNPRCAGCHTLLDPPGLALENYDAFGRYRTSQHGKTLDGSGVLTGTEDVDGPFTNAIDMTQKLARSVTVEKCFVRHGFRYFMGRPEDAFDSCALQTAVNAYQAGEGDFFELVAALFTSESFLKRSF